MEEEERRVMYEKIYQQFFMQSDIFLIQKWSGKKNFGMPYSEKEKTDAYQNFYQKIKKDKIANRQTIRRWFGLDGCSIPRREHIFHIAFSLGLSVEETEEYLQYGISDPGFQINDYSECIIMYCLDRSLDYETSLQMTEYFETHIERETPFCQIAHTDHLKKKYRLELKKMSKDVFLDWMCEHSSLFKGYSLTTLDLFQELIGESLSLFRKEMINKLSEELADTNFYSWAKEHNVRKQDYGEAIIRYVKNEGRRKNSKISKEKLSDIRYYATMGYSQRNRISDLLKEIYNPINLETCGIDQELSATIEREIGPVSAGYISELQNMAEHKEKMIRLNHAITQLKVLPGAATCPDWIYELLPKNAKKGCKLDSVAAALDCLKKIHVLQGRRVRNITRADLLIPLQYIVHKKYCNSLSESSEFRGKEAKESFIRKANIIMNTCGMRQIDPMYRIDYILLSCFKDDDVLLFAEIFEEECYDQEINV